MFQSVLEATGPGIQAPEDLLYNSFIPVTSAGSPNSPAISVTLASDLPSVINSNRDPVLTSAGKALSYQGKSLQRAKVLAHYFC